MKSLPEIKRVPGYEWLEPEWLSVGTESIVRVQWAPFGIASPWIEFYGQRSETKRGAIIEWNIWMDELAEKQANHKQEKIDGYTRAT